MINLLPPAVKEERKYGRLNRFMVKQVIGLGIIGALAVGFMMSGLQFIKNDETLINEAITSKQTEYEPLKAFEDQAKELNADVKTIQQLFERELKFSELLVKIATAIPDSARLTSLSLAEGDTAPLSITAIVDSQESAAVLRKSLVESDTFATADILSISDNETGENGQVLNYNTTITAQLIQKAPETTTDTTSTDTASDDESTEIET